MKIKFLRTMILVMILFASFSFIKAWKTPIGKWKYEIKNVPSEYQNGTFIIDKIGDSLSILVNDKAAYNIKSVNDSLYFSTDVNSDDANFGLEFKDTTLSGIVTYQSVSYDVSGEKVSDTK